MTNTTPFRHHIGSVNYRFGKVFATRLDLEGPADETESGKNPVEQTFNAKISTGPTSIRVEMDLHLKSEEFQIEVLVAGEWDIENDAPDDEDLRRAFAQEFALPRVAAIAEAEATALAKKIDVSQPAFTFKLDNGLLDSALEDGLE